MQTFLLIIKPVVTEKATAQEERGKYQLYVRHDATKIDIRETFKKLYCVDVVKVNVMRTPKKTRIGRGRKEMTKRPEYKKVIVTVKGKKKIDITKPSLKV
ncbi:50S ribosomal protein L23 [Candidatus Peregrinibacteria bacterium CG_4_9_14_0_2_um_filter_53_11]|nr:MAG: 50S ribosomal protein L23 [Candidatus Peregrinibacteria bacterium CG_4_9_14_0_2_um_filter_53_11]